MLLKEGKKVLMSIPFLIFVIVMVIDYQTQYSSALCQKIEEPQPGQEEYPIYGFTDSGDTEMIMQGAIETLIGEYSANAYSSYPFGFYKEVRLNDNEKAEMGDILAALTGYTAEEIVNTAFKIPYMTQDEETGALVSVIPDTGEEIPVVSEHVSYQEFQQLMGQASDLVGGGSSYSVDNLAAMGSRPLNYEEADEVYQQLRASGYSGGYARLLCDYLCIFSGLLPVFIAIAIWLRDRSAKMRDIVWTRKISSIRLTFARYGMIVLLCSAVVLIIAGIAALGLMKLYPGEVSGVFEFFRLTAIWVIPSIMASAAIGAFFTELTDTPAGILFMLGYWYFSIGTTSLTMGGLKWLTFMPRHNTEFMVEEFAANYSKFLVNRVLFVVASIALVFITAFILERKRRGRWFSLDKISIRRKKKSEI